MLQRKVGPIFALTVLVAASGFARPRIQCVSVVADPGSSAVWLANSCGKAMQAEIEWSGDQPARVVRYRVDPGPSSTTADMRSIERRDRTPTVVRERDASLGLGTRADVRLDVQQVDDRRPVQISNPNPYIVYAEWDIAVVKNGSIAAHFVGNGLISPSASVRVGVLFAGEDYRTERLAAETEEQ